MNTGLFIILEGEALMIDKGFPLCTLKTGDLFGHISAFLDTRVYSATV